MAIWSRQIQGTIVKPDGTPYVGGTIELDLSISVGTTTDDTGPETYVVGPKEVFPIGGDGTVDFVVVPNDKIDPSGSVWVATYHLPGNVKGREFWNVTYAVGVLQIGDIIRSNAGAVAGSQKFLIVSDFSLLPNPVVSLVGVQGFVIGDDGFEDISYFCMKGYDDVYRWVPSILGGGE